MGIEIKESDVPALRALAGQLDAVDVEETSLQVELDRLLDLIRRNDPGADYARLQAVNEARARLQQQRARAIEGLARLLGAAPGGALPAPEALSCFRKALADAESAIKDLADARARLQASLASLGSAVLVLLDGARAGTAASLATATPGAGRPELTPKPESAAPLAAAPPTPAPTPAPAPAPDAPRTLPASDAGPVQGVTAAPAEVQQQPPVQPDRGASPAPQAAPQPARVHFAVTGAHHVLIVDDDVV
ncbi:MAG: hypothetical protein HY815_11775, partial [Candidatus Riflebacteria bacterium]|nr:hypothetical protein [Candidatus Riflebacteria bacterium]